MRRAFVVLVLLAMMVGLQALKADASGGVDPLTLAAIGFVVLAAFAVAELGAMAGLPKVTGYIVTGVVFGPFVINVISDQVVLEMTMFSKLALGLIATSAGLELDLKGLRSLAKTLSATIVLKMVSGLVLVGGSFIAIELGFSVLGLSDTATTIALAVVFAALSLGTSPAIALAILSESRAKGRLSDLVLGAAIVKDVVVVVALAVAVALAKSMMPVAEVAHAVGHGAGHGAESSGALGVLAAVGEELGRSILAGALLGGLLIAYLRYIKAEMLLFVAAMVLVVVELSGWFHLELLLVFIVAGLVVRNFSKFAEDLHHPLETISLPVFIVFFTNAGASVNLVATLAVLPLALAMCVARALGFVVAGRIGGRLGGEPEPVQRLAWLGYLPQAGVTLGLVGLASNQLPAVSGEILTLGMAVVAVNLLVGPVTLRTALRLAKEIPSAQPRDGEKESPPSRSHPNEEAEHQDRAPWDRLEAQALRELAQGVHEGNLAQIRGWVSTSVRPWMDAHVERMTRSLSNREERDAVLTGIHESLEWVLPDDAPERVDVLLGVHARSTAALESIDLETTVPLEPRWRRPQPADGFVDAMRKRIYRVGDAFRFRFRNRVRTIPTRMLARMLVEPGLARGFEEAMQGWYRTEAHILEALRRGSLGTLAPREIEQVIRAHGDKFVSDVEQDLELEVARISAELVDELERVGGPTRPASWVRYSRVELEMERWNSRMLEDAAAWAGRRDAGARLVRVTNELSIVERSLDSHVHDQSLSIARSAFALLREELEGQLRRLAATVEHARGAETVDEETLSRLQMEAAALVPRPAQKKLRSTAARLRRATSSAFVSNLFRDAGIHQGGRETLVPSLGVLIDAPRPSRAALISLDVGEAVQGYLSAVLAPKVEESMSHVWTAFGTTREAMSACTSTVEFVLSSALRDPSEIPSPGTLADQLAQPGEALARVAESTWGAWEQFEQQMLDVLGGIDEHMGELTAGAVGRRTSTSVAPSHTRVRRFLVSLYQRYGVPAVEFVKVGIRRLRGEAEHGIGRQYRLRSGAERADAADVREFLRQIAEVDERLPPVYRALFAPEAVRDPRLFVAHRGDLQEVIRVERAWQENPETGNAVLIVGAPGTGKTSLVGIARLKLATRHVLVLPSRDKAEDPSLLAALARELGCEPTLDMVRTSLLRHRNAVVVDDLQDWLALGPAGVEELDDVLSILQQTRKNTFWLLSVSRELLEVAEPLVPIRPAFAQVIELGSVGHDELDAVIEARQALSGLEPTFPLDLQARWTARLLGRSPRDTYLRNLSYVTDGNLRRGLRAWTRRAHVAEDSSVVELDAVRVEWGLPLRGQLSAVQLALLSLLLRGGGRKLGELAPMLGLPQEHVSRDLRFLQASGLVVSSAERVSVAPALRDDVAAALREFGVIPGGDR